MAKRTFAQCSFGYKDLWDKESQLLDEILKLSLDVDFAAAVGTDQDFVKAKARLAMAEANLDAVLKVQGDLGLDFDAYFPAAA
jgi:hypothetical protein